MTLLHYALLLYCVETGSKRTKGKKTILRRKKKGHDKANGHFSEQILSTSANRYLIRWKKKKKKKKKKKSKRKNIYQDCYARAKEKGKKWNCSAHWNQLRERRRQKERDNITSMDIEKRAIVTHVESHANTVSLLESGEKRYIKRLTKPNLYGENVHLQVTHLCLYLESASPMWRKT